MPPPVSCQPQFKTSWIMSDSPKHDEMEVRHAAAISTIMTAWYASRMPSLRTSKPLGSQLRTAKSIMTFAFSTGPPPRGSGCDLEPRFSGQCDDGGMLRQRVWISLSTPSSGKQGGTRSCRSTMGRSTTTNTQATSCSQGSQVMREALPCISSSARVSKDNRVPVRSLCSRRETC